MLHDLCKVTGCINYGRYCRIPGHLKAPEQTRVVIPKVSQERKEVNKEYSKRYKKEKGKKTKCEYKIKGVCTGNIQGYNHPAGKHSKERLLNLKDGKFCCNACNQYCEDHPEKAMALGFIKKRNTQIKKYGNNISVHKKETA